MFFKYFYTKQKFSLRPIHVQNLNPISRRMSKYDVIKNVMQTAVPENHGQRRKTISLLQINVAITW